MIVAQFLRANYAMHICFHELLHKIHLGKVVETWWAENVEDRDDVFMVKVAQKLNLAKGTETEHGMIEWGDSFDCYFALRRIVNRRALEEHEWMIVRNEATDHTVPYAPSPMTSRGL